LRQSATNAVVDDRNVEIAEDAEGVLCILGAERGLSIPNDHPPVHLHLEVREEGAYD
jgi:hypothetical protein